MAQIAHLELHRCAECDTVALCGWPEGYLARGVVFYSPRSIGQRPLEQSNSLMFTCIGRAINDKIILIL